MKLSLLIPVYNEAGHLRDFFDQLSEVDFGGPTEWVIVDDRSKDESFNIANDWIATNAQKTKNKNIEVQIVQQEQNGGKGAAIQKAISLATGEILIVQDADFEYDPREVKSLVQPIRENRADVVFGSRFKKTAPQVHRTFHYFVNRFLTLMSNLLAGLYLTDMETCYKAFRAEILKNINLNSNRFGFEPEVVAHIARLKVRVMEFAISYFPRTYLEGKKISWKDGVAALWHITYFNLIMNDNVRFKPTLPKKYIPQGRQWL